MDLLALSVPNTVFLSQFSIIAFFMHVLSAIFKNGCLATSGATVGERNKLELMTSQNIKLRIICKDGDKSDCIFT